MRIQQFRHALDVLHFPEFGELPRTVCQSLDDVVLEIPEPGQVDLRLAKLDAPGFRLARLVDKLRHMEEHLRGNAAAVDAHAAGIRFGIDQGDAQAKIGCEKSGRVPAGAAADDNELSGDHG